MNQEKKIVKVFFWNSLASILLALQSVAMLMVIMRIGQLEDAGVFSFGFSNANLFLHLGRFGMRNYQSSDVLEKYSFRLYQKARIITIAVMIVGCSAFTLMSSILSGYTQYKFTMIMLLCVMKAIDAYEDVYHGNYQQHGHIDLAARLQTERIVLSFVVFTIDVIVFRDINQALVMSNLFSIAFLAYEIFYVKRKFEMPAIKKEDKGGTAKIILKECTPLFLIAFIAFLISNFPKYAIDFCLADSDQAIFGFLFMPVFGINVLANSIFQPFVSRLAILWNKKDYHAFSKAFRKQEITVVLLILVCICGVALLGIPFLRIIYNVNLEQYKSELIILMIGGGFYAYTILYTLGITIIRCQTLVRNMYLALVFFAGIIVFAFVKKMGIMGAALGYVLSMFMEAGIIMIIFYRKKNMMDNKGIEITYN